MELFAFVLAGVILGTCVHEFGHALAAYYGGDTTVKEKGYLTFNPIKYTEPFTTFVIPIICLALGGIPLPGGAVYINHQLIRSKLWSSFVALAGPLGTLAFTLVCSLPFLLGMAPEMYFYEDITLFWKVLGLLIMIEVLALIFNLLPVPGLDGFGIIRPYLSPEWQEFAEDYSLLAIGLLIIILFNNPEYMMKFFEMAFAITDILQVPRELVGIDVWREMMFWR